MDISRTPANDMPANQHREALDDRGQPDRHRSLPGTGMNTYEVVHTVITVVSAASSADAEAVARRDLEAIGVNPFSIVEGADSVEVGS